MGEILRKETVIKDEVGIKHDFSKGYMGDLSENSYWKSIDLSVGHNNTDKKAVNLGIPNLNLENGTARIEYNNPVLKDLKTKEGESPLVYARDELTDLMKGTSALLDYKKDVEVVAPSFRLSLNQSKHPEYDNSY
ncbi:MAG: hypothetical protein ACQEP1_00695 [Nanobdellota archaeon]